MRMNFLQELRRRNVLRVGAAYLVVGWFVLQSVDVVFPILGLDEALGRPILALLVIGLPVALLLAWFLELTPEGLKHERDVDRSAGEGPFGGRRLDRIIIVVLVAALGLLLVERFVIGPVAPPQAPVAASEQDYSLGVLPFINLGGSAEDDYFSDGLTETLLHMLAQIPELKVAARTSSFAFKGRNIDVRDIAESLGVTHILEGSVQRAGDRVRITAQLIEAASGFHLWSQTFDRDLADIFVVQDEIASNVASSLEVTLLGDEGGGAQLVAGVGTQSAEAYELYLQGLEQKNVSSYGSLPQAENFFKRALSVDPRFAEAKLELAKVYQLQAETGLLRTAEADARVESLIGQILEDDPEDGRAIGMLAATGLAKAMRTTGALSEPALAARQALESAIALTPNEAGLYSAMINALLAADQPEPALEWTGRGLDIDPLSARLHLQRGHILLDHLERPAAALEAFARARELAPGWTAPIFASGEAEMQGGDFASGLAWYLEAMRVDPQDHELRLIVAQIYYALGLDDAGDRMFERARAMAPQAPWTRRVELERQLRAGNYERAALLAEAMLRDEVENRGDAFNLAVMAYVSSMIELGRENRVAEFFDSLHPGIAQEGYVPQNIRELVLQFSLVHAVVRSGEVERAERMVAGMIPAADAGAPGWRDNAEVRMMLAIAQGDEDAAIEYALEDLDQPLAEHMGWEIVYRHTAWVKPLLSDGRLAARIERFDELTAAAARDVAAMLAKRGDVAG